MSLIRQRNYILKLPKMPDYKFYQNSTESKLELTVNGVEEDIRFLCLHNLSVTPFDQRLNFRLEIKVQGDKTTYTFPFVNLFHNPRLEPMLFFAEGDRKFKAIPLAKGFKNITYKIIALPPVKDFEVTLSSDYRIGASVSRS